MIVCVDQPLPLPRQPVFIERMESQVGQTVLHLSEKERGIVIPLKESCAFSFFKGALLKDPKHILQKDRSGSGRPLDQIHLPQRNYGCAVDSEELHPRSH
jgi:hypothetical protein